MDVLELPRPVINFLRTMAKEGCRYVLSWDIFGGSDAVTLTLTWKLSDDQSQVLISKSPQQEVYDDLQICHNDSISSPRRSRRDDNTFVSSIFRSPRGKSSEDNNRTPIKYIAYHQPQRSSIIYQQKKDSDPIYANLCNVKYTTNPLPLNNNPPLSVAHTHYRQAKQECEIPILRKFIPLPDTSSKLKQRNTIAIQNNDDDDDDILNPWVKRFDEDNIDRTEVTAGKVKFKKTPDYF
jgi:hypothetical protein